MSEHGTIVQTNIDHWSSAQNEDILFSIQRRALSRQILNSLRQFNEDELWKVREKDFLGNISNASFSRSSQRIRSSIK